MFKLHPALARIVRVLAFVGLVCAALALAFQIPGTQLTTVPCVLIVARMLMVVKRGQLRTGMGLPAAGYRLGVAGIQPSLLNSGTQIQPEAWWAVMTSISEGRLRFRPILSRSTVSTASASWQVSGLRTNAARLPTLLQAAFSIELNASPAKS